MLRKLEQTGTIALLFFLKERGESKIMDFKYHLMGEVSQPTIYRALDALLKMNLIEEEIDPPRRLFRLTPKGLKVVEKLVEIDEILKK